MSEEKALSAVHLHFDQGSKTVIANMASATLKAGGYAEPAPAEAKIGDRMPDGTILAGISPDTGKPMYVTPADAPLSCTFNEAKKYAAGLGAHGHCDWRVPSKNELNLLFNNRAAIGGFNLRGSNPPWYWSASQDIRWYPWCLRFSDGDQGNNLKLIHLSVRLVR